MRLKNNTKKIQQPGSEKLDSDLFIEGGNIDDTTQHNTTRHATALLSLHSSGMNLYNPFNFQFYFHHNHRYSYLDFHFISLT